MLTLTVFMGKIVLLAILFASVLIVSVNAAVVEKIVAVVNNNVITLSDLEEETYIERQLGNTSDKAKILDYMIEEKIVSAEASRLGLVVAMDEVTARIVYFQGTFPSREEFGRFLDTYEISLQELSRKFASRIAVNMVRQQKEGISPGRYEKWFSDTKKKADIKMMDNGL